MKNSLFFLIVLSSLGLLLQSCTAGSDTVVVAGQVIEAGTGNAISSAIVEVTTPENIQQTATTDSAGNFSFDIDPGTEAIEVTLEISKQAYQTTTTSFKVAPETNVDDLTIELVSTDSQSGGNDSGTNNDDTVGGESGPPNSLELVSISSSSIAIRGTGGDETSKFTFSVTDSAGRPVTQGYAVDFSIIQGPGGGEYISPPPPVTTSSQGTVSAAIASGDSAGVVKIRASINQDVQSTPVLVAIGNGFPESENFRIFPKNQNFEAWGIISGADENVSDNYIIASLGDYRNNPVLPGTAVDFTTTAGIIQANAVTDDNGMALAWIRPDGSKPTGHSRGIAFATVTARTVDINDNYITDSADLLFTSRDPSIQVYNQGTTTPATVNIPSGGSQNFDMVIEDVNGYPVAAGSEISVESSDGTSNTFGTITLGDFTSPGPGRTQFGFTVSDSDPVNPTEQEATVTVTVTLPSGASKSVTY